jgi:cystinosin
MFGFLGFLSLVFGWVYTFCWSASFYPQPLLNWRRKSTSGTTVDFPLINIIGFATYFASNVALYYSPLVRAQYAARNRGLAPTVQLNDVVFALHALVLSSITASQYVPRLWPAFAHDSASSRPSRFILGISSGCLVGVLITLLLVTSASDPSHKFDPVVDWCALDVVYSLGYVKLLITLVKFTPQILANWRNRSTAGWSIYQILLDVAGGVLSIAQQGIDSWLLGDWSGISGNPVKFALGNVSLFYDSIFVVQHYILYRDPSNARAADGQRRVVPDEERRLD